MDVVCGEKLLFPTSGWLLCSHFLLMLWSLSVLLRYSAVELGNTPETCSVNYKSCYLFWLHSCPGAKRRASMQRRWCPLHPEKQSILQCRGRNISNLGKKRNSSCVLQEGVQIRELLSDKYIGSCIFIIVNAGYFWRVGTLLVSNGS